MALNYLDKAAWDAGVYKDKGNDDDTQQDTSSEDSGYSASGILSAAKNFLEHPFQGTGTVIAPNYTPRPLDDSVYSDIPGTPVASGQFGELEDESVRDERMKDSADYMAANWPRLYGGVVAADEGLANVVGGIQNAVGGGNGILTNVQRAEEGMQNYRDQWNNEYGDSYFLNPNKFATDVGSGIGSTVPIMALSALMPGAAVAGGTRALTSALSRAGLGRLAMSEAGQALIADTVRSPISSLADSLSEYGTVVNDMMQDGMSEDEARRRAIPMFFKNMALDTFTVPLELGVMKGGKGIATSLLGRSAGEGVAKSIAKGAARTGMLAGASGLTEGYQEGAQNALENDVEGNRDGGWYNPFTWTNEDWEAARGGFVGGALMGVPGNVAAGFHPEARQAPLSAESQEQAQSIKDTLSHGKPAGMSNAAYNAYIELANSGNPDLIKQAASSLESFQQSQEGSQESTGDAATEAYKDYETYDQKQEIENFLDNNTVEQIGGEKNFNWLWGVLHNGTPEEVQHAYDTVIAAEKATAEQEAKNRPASSGGSMSPNTGNAMANIVIQAANDSGVEPRLGLAIAARESGGDDVNAISMPEPHDGVYGVMQAQEETVSNMGLDSQYPDWKTDPYQNAMVGMAILKAKIDGENGDVWAGVRDYDGAGEEAEQYRQLVKNNYDNMGDIGGGGGGSATYDGLQLTLPDSDEFTDQSGNVSGLTEDTRMKLRVLDNLCYQKFGQHLIVSSSYREGDPNNHGAGVAFDVSGGIVDDPDARQWLEQAGPAVGLFVIPEYQGEAGAEFAHGDNVHFSNVEPGIYGQTRNAEGHWSEEHAAPSIQSILKGGASSGVSSKVTSDNGQFERELDQAAQEAKSDMDKIQAQSDQAVNEIMNDDSAEKTAQDAQQDAENAQKQAKESQQSAQDDVVPDVAQTIRDTSNNIDEINTLDGMFTKDSNGNDKFIDTPENRDFIKTNYKDEIAKAVNDAMSKKKAPSATPVPKAQQQTPHARLGRILSTHDRKDPKFKEYMNTFRNGTEQEQKKLADDLQTTQELERANSLKGNPLTTQQDQNIPQNVPQQAVEAPKQTEQVNTPVQEKESLETQKKRKIYLAKKQKLMERVPAGKTVKVHASTNDAGFDATYKIVPAGDITASHDMNYAVNDLYPAEYQPRDRNRPQMRGQVEKMTKGMKPELLAESQFVNEGAPVVNNSGVVLNGNGRVMAVQKAYKGLADAHKKSAKAYKGYLVSIAPSLGIAPEKVQSMEHPVLVRQAADDADTSAIINSTEGGAKLGGAEQAKADTDRLKLSTLEQFVDNGTGEFMNPSNREFRRAAASDVFSDAEGNSVFNEKGDLSPTGAFRIRNAIFAKAYNDNYLLTQLSEATDNNSKNIMNAMIAAAPEVAKVNEGIKNGALYPDYDISDVITKTAKTIMSLRNEGKPLSFHLQETDLFSQGESEAERLVLEFIERNKFKSRTIADMYKGACDRIFAVGRPKQSKLFDSKEAPRISLENIISNAIQEVEHGQSLFDTTEEKPAEKAVSEVPDNRQAEPAGSGRVHQQEAGRVQSQEKEGNEVDEKSKQSDHVDAEPQQTESKDKESTHAEEGSQGDVQEEVSKFHNVLDDEKSTPKQIIDAYKSVVDKVIANANGSRKNAKIGDKIVTDEYQSLTNSKHWNAFMNEDGGRNWHEVATINADAHKTLRAIIKVAGVKFKEAPSSQGIAPYKQAVDDIMDKLAHKKLTPAQAINKLKTIMKDANAARWGEFNAMEAIESKEKLSFDDYKMALDLANDAMKKANDMRLEASRKRKARKTEKELESATEETNPAEQSKEKAGFTDDEINTLTDRGFKRWTKKLSNGKVMDRLYIKPEYLGLELTRYKSGNISSATFNGERISNSEARRIEGTKCYVDVATKEVVCDREDLKQAAQEVIDDALSKEKSQVPAQAEKGNKPDELRNQLSDGGKQAYDYALDNLLQGNGKVAQSAKENAFIYARMAERWSEIMHEYGNKTYSPEDYTKSHPIVMGQQSGNAQLERAFEQRAWHGSPYDFNSFDLGYIGAGEGNQVHGWGLYFAKDKKISEAYKDIFGYKDIKANVDGKTYHMDEEGDWTVDGNTVEYGTAMGYVLDTISNTGNKEKAIADLESSLNKNKIRGHYADEARKAIDILKNRDVSISKGETLYSVEIPNNAYLLDEDKPIYNQSKTVKRSLLKAVQELPEKQQDRFLEKLVPGLTAKSKATIKAEAQLNTTQSAVNGLKELDEKPLSSLPAFRQRIRKSLFEKIVGSDNVEKVISDTAYRNATIKKLADDVTKQGKIILQLHKKDADRSTARRKELKDNLAQTINTYGLNGKHFYESLSYGLTGDVNKQADASKYLDKYGIKGIKYIGNADGQCFVIFDDKAVQIIDKYNQDVHNAKAAYDASTGAIRLFDIADQSSFIHESAHMFLSDMERLAQKKDAPAGLVSDLQTVKDWAGYKPGQMKGYKGTALEKEFQEYADAIREAKKTGDAVAIKSAEARWMHERFARGFERYIADGKAPNESLKNVFEKFKEWMVSIYQDLKNLGKKPPKEIQDVMARMITPKTDTKYSAREAHEQLTRSKEDLKAEQDAENTHAQLAYHGTPHMFDHFDLTHIGSGYGVQAHGWGLYFAANKNIANAYKEAMEIPEGEKILYLNGKKYTIADSQHLRNVETNEIESNRLINAAGTMVVREGSIEGALKRLHSLANRQKGSNGRGAKMTADSIALLEQRNTKYEAEPRTSGVYAVDIPESNTMLDEQKTISEQPAKVKRAIYNMVYGTEIPTNSTKSILTDKNQPHINKTGTIDLSTLNKMTGKELYSQLANSIQHNQKSVSLLLNKYGIKGITYDGGIDGRCYVVFDDQAIAIQQRYDTALNNHMPELKRSYQTILANIKKAFPNGKIIKEENNKIVLQLPNGSRVYVDIATQCILTEKEMAKAKKEHGYSQDADVVAQGFERTIGKDGFIQIAENSTDGTEFHEAFHFAKDVALTSREKQALDRANNKQAKAEARSIDEVESDNYAKWRKEREKHRGTAFGRLYNKITDFATKVLEIFKGVDNVHSIFRNIESGEVWNRTPGKGNGQTRYSVREDDTERQETTVKPQDIITAINDIVHIYEGSKLTAKEREELKKASKFDPDHKQADRPQATELYDRRAKAGFNRMGYFNMSNYGRILALHLDNVMGLKGNLELTRKSIERQNKNAAEAKMNGVKEEKLSPSQARQRAVMDFGAMMIRNPELARETYPAYSKIFDEGLEQHPDLKEKLDKVIQLNETYQGQTAAERAAGSIAREKEKVQLRKHPKEWLSTHFDKFYTNWVDDKHAFAKVVARAEAELGRKLAYDYDVHKQAQMAINVASSRALLFLTGGKGVEETYKVLNKVYGHAITKNVTMKDIMDALNKVSKEDVSKTGAENAYDALGNYLIAMRTEELEKHYHDAYARSAGFDEEGTREIIQNTPESIKKIAQMYWDINTNIVNILQQQGLISKDLAGKLRKYKHYCPMYRDMSDGITDMDEMIGTIGVFNKGGGYANVSNGIKRIEGGGKRPILDPITSLSQMAVSMISKCERNDVAKTFVKLGQDFAGLGDVVVRDPTLKHADPTAFAFTVWQNGEQVAYRTMPEIYDALTNNDAQTNRFTIKMASSIAQTLRTGATISPSFIVRNLLRDTMSATVNSKTGFYLPFVDNVRGAWKLHFDKEFSAEYHASGASMSTYMRADADSSRDLTKELLGHKYDSYPVVVKQVRQLISYAWHKYEKFGNLIEDSTRAGEFRRARNQGLSIDQAGQLAREITLDFSRHGKKGQMINKYVPFFNATIQGTDKFIRTFKDNPMRAILNTVIWIVLPSLGLWAINHDDDWYKELDENTKYTNWAIPLPGGTHLLIPKPQEVGILFGSGIEAVLNQMTGTDPHGMKEWARQYAEAMTPSLYPAVVRPLIEWMTNYSFWTGRNLVPASLQKAPSEMQFTSYTSELAKSLGDTWLAKSIKLSPIAIDNWISGWFGSAGRFVANMLNDPISYVRGNSRPSEPAKYWYEMPVIGSFVRQNGQNSEYVNRMYEIQKDMNDDYERSDAGKQRKGKKSSSNKPKELKQVDTAVSSVSKLNKEIKAIRNDPKKDPDRKRQEIDQRRTKINDLAKKVVLKFDK